LRPGILAGRGLVLPLAVGVLGVLLVPGWLALRRAGITVSAWDAAPFAFAASLIGITILTIVSLEAHLASGVAAALVAGAGVILGLWEAMRPSVRPEPASPEDEPADEGGVPHLLECALLLGLLVLAWTFLTVGGTRNPTSVADLQEEALHLSILRKLTENDALSTTNVMYKPGVVTTYVYPAYHFALALVSRVSGLDPVAVYLSFRPVAALLALLTLRSLSALLFRSRAVADLSLLVWLFLVATNAAGQVSRYFWAQLVPLSHLGDFALGVLYPLLLLFTFRYLIGPEPRRFRFLTPALIAITLVVHTREVLQLLVFLVAAGAFALLRADRRSLQRLGTLMALVLVTGLAYQRLHSGAATDAVTFEVANREAFRGRFHEVLQQPLLEVLRKPNPGQYRLLGRGPFLLALVAIPFLWFIRRPWARFAAPGLLVMALVTRIPYLSFPFILLTYAEMLQTPPRYFLHWGYLILGAAVAGGVLALARLQSELGRRREERSYRVGVAAGLFIAAVVVGEAAFLTLRGLEALSVRNMDWLYAFAIVGSLPGIGLALWRRSSTAEPPPPPGEAMGLVVLLFGIAAAAPLLQYVFPPSLRDQYVEWARRPSVGDFWTWYNASDFDRKVPGSIVRFLREEVPEGAVVAAPARFAYVLPVLTNHYIVSWGYLLGTDINVVAPYEVVKGVHREFSSDLVRGYLDRESYAREVQDLDPMFNARVSPEERLAYLREYGIDYVVSGPIQLSLYEQLAGANPGVLEEMFSRRDYAVFRVRRDHLPVAAPSSAAGASGSH
jgi:hypothetical protein